MLRIKIKETELFDEKTSTFHKIPSQTLTLEHSLISISKWESKWHKPFLDEKPKTIEEETDYIRCMTVKDEADPMVYQSLTMAQRRQINDYINDSMTATWFNERDKKGKSRKVITSELIYYWMVALQIPFECEKWHLNRLLTLVRVCNIENSPKKKMNKKDALAQRRSLNAARRQKYNTHG